MGLSIRERPYHALRRCALRLRWGRVHEGSYRAPQSHFVFRRLVGLDGLTASRRERAMAASRPAFRSHEYRPRVLRQLPAALRLDDRHRRARRFELERAGAELLATFGAERG